MWAIFLYWLSLCLLIAAPIIALALTDYFKLWNKGWAMSGLVALPFIGIHVIWSIVPFIITTLLMMFSIPHCIILVPRFCAPLV